MRLYRFLGLAFLVPAVLVFSTAGCNKKGGDEGGGGQAQNTGGGGGPKAAKKPLEGKGVAVLKGKVIFEGDLPKDDGKLKMEMAALKDKGKPKDAEVCLAGSADETTEWTWRINPENKGVKNAVIWVKPPDGFYFPPNKPDEKVWKKASAFVDQPHCAFEPHVLVVFPAYFDGKSTVPSGQEILIKNSAPIPHNSNWAGRPLTNPAHNIALQPETKEDISKQIKVDEEVPVSLKCDIHTGLMHGYIWPLGTPFYAVTDANGEYKIEGLPAGTEVRVVSWHEGLPSGGWIDGGAKGISMKLKEGDNEKNFTIKK